MDEAQVFDDAIRALREVRSAYGDDGEFVGAIDELEKYIEYESETRAVASKIQKSADREVEQPAEAFVRLASKKKSKLKAHPPGYYQTAVFKCLSDYEKCLRRNNPWLCKALMAICVAKHLVPLAPHG